MCLACLLLAHMLLDSFILHPMPLPANQQVLQRRAMANPGARANGAITEGGLAVARALIGIAIAFSLLVSSVLFAVAISSVRADFDLARGGPRSSDAGGEKPGEGSGGKLKAARLALPRRRLVGFIVGGLVLGAAVLGILALSLIACFAPGLFGKGGAPPDVVSTGDIG